MGYGEPAGWNELGAPQVKQADYTAVANALVPVLNSDFNTLVPSWARGMIPPNEAQALAGALAKAAVDALDAFRATRNPTP